mgnify:CR=1 FL=1
MSISSPFTGPSARRIAIEEHFITPAVSAEFKRLLDTPSDNLDWIECVPVYSRPNPILDALLDIDGKRIEDMNAGGVDMSLLSLAGPGVQMFETSRAVGLAVETNDFLVDVIRKHPTRFGGLATVAPQAPKAAAKEMARAINTLGLHGFMINSHTNNRYLDDPYFWPILEVAEALDRPIYLHPRMPSDGMAEPFRDIPLTTWAFGIETGHHAVRLMFSGVLDRFPNIRIVLGHMGEALHFWQWRLDQWYKESQFFSPNWKKLGCKPSEYLKRNFVMTPTGNLNPDALEYSLKTLGADNILFAVDYPYQPHKPTADFVDITPMTDEERRKIYYGNAEKLFGVKSVAEAAA